MKSNRVFLITLSIYLGIALLAGILTRDWFLVTLFACQSVVAAGVSTGSTAFRVFSWGFIAGAAIEAMTFTTMLQNGRLGLVIWFRLGGRYLGEKIATPFRATGQFFHDRWIAQPLERKRLIRLGSWIFYGLVVAVMIASGWWRWFGPMAALSAAGMILALLIVIAMLDAHQGTLK